MRLFTGLSKEKKSIFQSGAAGSSTESAVSGQIRKDWTFSFSSQVLVPHSNCKHPKREQGWGDECYHEVNGKKKLNVYRHGTLVRAKTTSPPSKNRICLNLCPFEGALRSSWSLQESADEVKKSKQALSPASHGLPQQVESKRFKCLSSKLRLKFFFIAMKPVKRSILYHLIWPVRRHEHKLHSRAEI